MATKRKHSKDALRTCEHEDALAYGHKVCAECFEDAFQAGLEHAAWWIRKYASAIKGRGEYQRQDRAFLRDVADRLEKGEEPWPHD